MLRKRKKERAGSTPVRNIDQLPSICPQLGVEPTTQICALTGNQTGNLLVQEVTFQATESH